MRRLEVDRKRDGSGALVGTISITYESELEPYKVPTVFHTIDGPELSREEVAQLADLVEFCHNGDGKQHYPNVIVPKDLFLKLAEVWRIE